MSEDILSHIAKATVSR